MLFNNFKRIHLSSQCVGFVSGCFCSVVDDKLRHLWQSVRTPEHEADSQDRSDLSLQSLYSISSDTILSWATNKGAPSEIRALGIPHTGEGAPARWPKKKVTEQFPQERYAAVWNQKQKSCCLRCLLLSIILWRTTLIITLKRLFYFTEGTFKTIN